ncbi:MAG: recombinase family protein [bacterium]|nr:recombinase family protein [bacterium]MDZ4345240.1 recombinase family protein [Candidatus Binatia bacterium]
MAEIMYCLYARKSTERDELQALSIESQIKEMLAQAERDNITIKEIRRESHSAKTSGERPVFMDIIRDIRAGIFSGMLTWAPDRLSRNAGDLGTLVDLMDQGKLHEIRTHGQVFHNSPNEKFLLMILCSQAKLENDNKSINVKRGLRAKCEMGYRPGMTPLGYINLKYENKGEKKIILDPERAPIILEMFQRADRGASGRDLLRWVNNKTNFVTRTGKQLVLSAIYVILRNPYYCGKYEFPKKGGVWYEVAHESIVPKKLWDSVQEKLTVGIEKAKPGTKIFDFTKMLTCGSCLSGVTAEERFKDIVDGTKRRYVYYHCTHSRNLQCKEPYIREEVLIDQLVQLLDTVDIDTLAVKERLATELARHQIFMKKVLHKNGTVMVPEVDVRSYAKHVLQDGSREEKREILSCITTKLYLRKKQISTKAPRKRRSHKVRIPQQG